MSPRKLRTPHLSSPSPTAMSSPPHPSHLYQLLLPLALIILMAFAVIAFRFYTYEFHTESIDEVLLPVSPEPSQAAFNSIGVGIVAGNLYNFDAGKKSFDADGWFWITWSPEADKQMKRKSMTPRDLFFFYNGVNDYDFSILPDTVSPTANGERAVLSEVPIFRSLLRQ